VRLSFGVDTNEDPSPIIFVFPESVTRDVVHETLWNGLTFIKDSCPDGNGQMSHANIHQLNTW
jgi:hypothetical protein